MDRHKLGYEVEKSARGNITCTYTAKAQKAVIREGRNGFAMKDDPITRSKMGTLIAG